jgi:hypothetical protein
MVAWLVPVSEVVGFLSMLVETRLREAVLWGSAAPAWPMALG